jgi:uncharacterized membrane protein
MESMVSMLGDVSQAVATIAEALAILMVALGTLEALVSLGRVLRSRAPIGSSERREAWLGYARWLVGALTFQLAADIAGTSISAAWDDLTRLVIVALLRTFLSHYLDRESAAGGEHHDVHRGGIG